MIAVLGRFMVRSPGVRAIFCELQTSEYFLLVAYGSVLSTHESRKSILSWYCRTIN